MGGRQKEGSEEEMVDFECTAANEKKLNYENIESEILHNCRLLLKHITAVHQTHFLPASCVAQQRN